MKLDEIRKRLAKGKALNDRDPEAAGTFDKQLEIIPIDELRLRVRDQFVNRDDLRPLGLLAVATETPATILAKLPEFVVDGYTVKVLDASKGLVELIPTDADARSTMKPRVGDDIIIRWDMALGRSLSTAFVTRRL